VTGSNSVEIQFQGTGDYVNTYSWSFGDDFYSNEQSPTHTFGYNGVFPVELVGTGACGSDTVVQLITINTVQVQEFEENNFTIKQTGENLIEINFIQDKFSTDAIEIYSLSGEKIPFKTLNSSDTKLELYLTAKGGLFIVMNASLNPVVKRIFLN
jgi:PKD repeat protein